MNQLGFLRVEKGGWDSATTHIFKLIAVLFLSVTFL
jgi:hypothetical protein